MTVTALTLAPVDPEWVKEAVAAYIKAYVRRRVEAGESKRAIGLSLGFKGGQRINQYVDPKKYGRARTRNVTSRAYKSRVNAPG